MATAVAQCLDPPVINGIFETLGERFQFKFEFGDETNGIPWGMVKVTDLSNGSFIKAEYDHTV